MEETAGSSPGSVAAAGGRGPATHSAPAVDYFNRWHPLHGIKSRVALNARRRMYERVLAAAAPTRDTRIVDVGTTPDLLLPYNNFFERWYPYPDRVDACSVEECSNLERHFPGLRFTRITGADLPYEDGQFDLAVSFAVLEHVGSRLRQQHFLRELARVARAFVLFTPYRYFPVEMHTLLPVLHWLPAGPYRALLRALGMPFWADEQHLNLLSVRDVRRILPSHGRAEIGLVWTAGWPSNIEVIWRCS